MNKKKMIITSACGSLVIGLSAFAGYEYGRQQAYETTSLVQNTAQALVIIIFFLFIYILLNLLIRNNSVLL